MKKFKHWGLKRRQLPDHNYNALWLGDTLKTIRFGEGHAKDLPYTCKEFFDIAVNNRCNLLCPFCLVPSTKIQTSAGSKNIEDLKIGDIVQSYNEELKAIEEKRVVQTYERDVNEDIMIIEDENHNIIKLTQNHKVYTNRGWVEAKNLRNDDEILNF